MADVFQDAVKGERLRITSQQFNGWNFAGRYARDRAKDSTIERSFGDSRRPEVVRVLNGTGAALAAGAVLALGVPGIGPDVNAVEFETKINFEGSTPAAATDLFCITIDPLPADEDVTGLALVSGAAFVEINVGDASHTHATPYAGQNAYMASAYGGPARILWKESGTGIKRAYVLIGGQQRSSTDWKWTATKSADYDPAVGEAVPINYDAANRTIRLPVGATVNDRIMLVPLYSSGGFKVILSGVLNDGATGYNLNGVAASGNFIGTGFGTGEGAYVFVCKGTADWVCERPLS